MTNNSTPRAYTEEEVRDMLLNQIRALAKYWAKLPDVDPVTGQEQTVQDRCEGVAFSILTMLDGCGMTMPAITLKLDPHEEDKEYCQENGANWFEPGMEISEMLHEHFHKDIK